MVVGSNPTFGVLCSFGAYFEMKYFCLWISYSLSSFFLEPSGFIILKPLFWKNTKQPSLSLTDNLVPIWEPVKDALCSFGFHRSGTADHLMWIVPNAKLSARVKDIYTDMIILKASSSCSIYPLSLCKSGFPLKMILFSWLVFNNRNLTWQNLRKRN